ncbi:MAG TPA: YIP1 family protein [Candidatus Angelobacter sp.]|nr:YIP1 family protein [Candidatus Angelobacter sp.]
MSSPTGPTPPPPPMYAAPVPPTAPEPTGPGLSEPQRLVNVFIAPSKTFADLKRNPSWWVPWLISAVFTLIFSVIAVQKIDMARFVQEQIDRSPRAQKRLENLTPEQRAQGMAIQATFTKVGFYAAPILTLLGGLIVAAVLMFVYNFILGAEVPFPRAMAVVFYAGIPGILGTILLIISFLASSDPNTIDITRNPMPTNPAFFMDPEGNKVLYGLASAIDIFKIWWVCLIGLGFSAASSNKKPNVATSITAAFVCYGIVVLIGIGFKVIFS